MTDANTPAWLADNPNNNGATDTLSNDQMDTMSAMTGPTTSTTTGSRGAVPAAGTASEEPENPDLPGVILTMRLLNIGIAGLIIAVSVRLGNFRC
jgi:hypothetical protein